MKKKYETPILEYVEVRIEAGFAASVTEKTSFEQGSYEEENW